MIHVSDVARGSSCFVFVYGNKIGCLKFHKNYISLINVAYDLKDIGL